MKRRIILTISIALNLLMVGVIIGYGMKPANSIWRAAVTDAIRTLPQERQQLILQAFTHIHEDAQTAYIHICSARSDAANLLKANPFNQTAYLAQIQRVQDLRTGVGIQIGTRLAQLAQQLSPLEREMIAAVSQHLSVKDYALSNADKNKPGCKAF